MTPCKFTFDDTPAFAGFSHGSKWNGFDNVAITPAVREQIVEYFIRSGDPETARDLWSLETMEDGLISLGWAYTTTIVEPLLHFTVRDRATQGTDFLVWGVQETASDDTLDRAMTTLTDALRDGLDVELIITRKEA